MTFLLSYAEANKYFGVAYGDGKKADAAARIAATAYAEKQGAYTNNNHKTEDGAATTWWWLRSPGNNRRNAAHVDYDGSLIPRSVSVDRGCVRPALWVNLDADFFQWEDGRGRAIWVAWGHFTGRWTEWKDAEDFQCKG